VGEALLIVLWYLGVGLGVTLGYHRALTHRSARLVKPVLYALVWAGAPAGPVAEWVGNHRRHHRHADNAEDPHCPARAGFWYAHCGWYLGINNRAACGAYALGGPLRLVLDVCLRPTAPAGHARLAPDVLADPWLRWLSSRAGFACAAATHLAPFAWASARHGSAGLLAAWALSVLMYNIGDSVNSVLHLWGEKPLAVGDDSRNHALLAWLTLGEGWHNGHHAFPSSAKHGLLPGQFDLTFEAMRLLRVFRLAAELRLPGATEVARRLRAPESEPRRCAAEPT
jgi:fatty-acid desaturase